MASTDDQTASDVSPVSVNIDDIIGTPQEVVPEIVSPAPVSHPVEMPTRDPMRRMPSRSSRPQSGGDRGGRRQNGYSNGGPRRRMHSFEQYEEQDVSEYNPNRMIDPARAFEFGGEVDGRVLPDAGIATETITGVLDTSTEGHGVLRSNFSPSDRDAYISTSQIRRFGLRPGDLIEGPARAPKESERYWGLLKVDKVNGLDANAMIQRVKFHTLTPVYPNEKFKLETGAEPLSTRLIDLVAPIGKGQRGLIVSPPKAGKTTIMKEVSTGIAANYPEVHLMAVLIGERPEEVTDIRRHIAAITKGKGEVAASNFDESPEYQARAAELAIERAKRLVELGNDVVILLDSITRLARAYNLAIPTSGRTLSGGFDPAALTPPKKFFGAARCFEEFDTPQGKKRGSLTILGTALVDTGSRMDDLVYEEFKGTGNMELFLDRQIAERRIYPAIDIQRSGTRNEELLFSQSDYQSIVTMRRMIDMLGKDERTSILIDRLKKTKGNKEFLASLKEG
ncbi:MAG TPA: transcription termination factor Rho [Patescibacteria group bacterium]|nr:transcription termination factor Rho [Patescibacteria group bacterium]